MEDRNEPCSNMNDRVSRLEQGFNTLSAQVIDLMTRMTVQEELSKTRQENTDREIGAIKASLEKIQGNTTWLVRLIIGSIIGAFLMWVYRGGLGVQ